MRPEISGIIKLLYNGLEDGPNVLKYQHIRGVDKDLFFVNHNQKEATNEGMMSKMNDHEA
jgi:hypothetical protein